MKRYTWIWDEDGFWFYAVKKGTPLLEDPTYEMVLASDVAKLLDERARLRDVLEKIADGQDGTGWRIQSTGYAENVQRMAREALYEKV